MGQFKNLLAKLSMKQRISIGVVAVIVIAALYGFVHWRHEQDFKPLYTGVAAEDAATIIQKIKESGTEYRLSESGGVISVPADRVAELRLELAAVGLPHTGRIGFELFDKTNFGATEFVEHVNYNRALEGELERSIATLNPVEQARVHLTAAKDSVFVESREPAKASVVVKLRLGAALQPQNVTAIQQLIASAVEGLDPADVSVLDTRGNLLSRPKLAQQDASDAIFDRRQRIEHDLLEKINNTLEPLLGHDKFRAGVTVDCDLTTAEQDEETFDPNKSVMTASKKTEEVMTGNATAGVPGTASNLPKPPVRVGGPSNMTTRRSEDVNYESSHVIRKTHIPNGGVRRMSISVLLDQRVHWEGKGAARHLIPVPPTPETIKAVHDLVAGVTGFAQDRGDQITVESLPFEATLDQAEPETSAPSAGKAKPFDIKELLKDKKMLLIGAGAGAAVLLLLVGAVVFLLMKRKKSGPAPAANEKERVTKADLMKAVDDAKHKAAIEAANAAEQVEVALAEKMAEQHKQDMAAIAALKLPTIATKKAELLTKEIRETAKKDPGVAAHVIQTWLHEG
jgi:flagellar M-ring protein FliF